MRVLAIGGTGFIGCPTVRALLAGGHDVAVLHRGSRPPMHAGPFEWIQGDRRQLAEQGGRLLAWRPDVVVDFIAFTETDVRAVVDVFRGVASRLIVLSSVDVYRAYDRLMRVEPGDPEATPLREDAPLRGAPFPRRRWATGPEDIRWKYDKIPVERAALMEPGLPATVLRLPAVYGPGDHRRHRVGQYLGRMDSGPPTLPLDAALSRWRWTRGYVDDVASAVALASTDPRAVGRTYNVGETEAPTEGEWVRAIARVAEYPGQVIDTPRQELPLELRRELNDMDLGHDLVMDTSRVRTELGWSPVVPLDDALSASIEWERRVRREASGPQVG